MKRHVLISVLVAGLLLLPVTARAALTIIGHYDYGGGTVFDVAYNAENGGKVSLLGMKGNINNVRSAVSITFSKNEWNSFVALWRKAMGTQSSSFQFVGTYKETNTKYNSLLTVAAGPGVQFTINDQPGTLVFVLRPADFARFDADVAKVTAFFNSN